MYFIWIKNKMIKEWGPPQKKIDKKLNWLPAHTKEFTE